MKLLRRGLLSLELARLRAREVPDFHDNFAGLRRRLLQFWLGHVFAFQPSAFDLLLHTLAAEGERRNRAHGQGSGERQYGQVLQQAHPSAL